MFTEHQMKLVLMKVTNLSKDLLIKSSGGSAVKVTNLHPATLNSALAGTHRSHWW